MPRRRPAHRRVFRGEQRRRTNRAAHRKEEFALKAWLPAWPADRLWARAPGALSCPEYGGLVNEDARETPVITRGQLLCYRVFDVGDTIALDVAQSRLGAKRVEMGGPLVEGLVIPVRPLELHVADCAVKIERVSRLLQSRCCAHVFDFGAISFLYEIPI